jgi:hypothetical protein
MTPRKNLGGFETDLATFANLAVQNNPSIGKIEVYFRADRQYLESDFCLPRLRETIFPGR